MPSYIYRCTNCDHTYEKRKRFSDPHDTVCPLCAGEVRHVIHQVGIVFKGSGFYVTDNRSGNAARPAAAKSTADAPAAEATGSATATADAPAAAPAAAEAKPTAEKPASA